MKVSIDWYIAVEYQRLSSIRIIFVDYQTSKLQYNYQSYIQVYSIKDTQGFRGIVPIAPSGGFSIETLIGVQLCHERLSQIEVSPSWKIESPDCYITAIWACCKKDSYYRRQAFRLDIDKEYYHRNMFSRQVDLAYDSILLLRLSF